MQCKAIKPDGNQCKGYTINGSDYCYCHSKQNKKIKGVGNKKTKPKFGIKTKIKNPEDVKNLMEKAINAIWTGRMQTTNPASSLGYLSRIFLDAYDKAELCYHL